jgi:hypothetical protein
MNQIAAARMTAIVIIFVLITRLLALVPVAGAPVVGMLAISIAPGRYQMTTHRGSRRRARPTLAA